MAMCDSAYRFTMVDIGASGRHSDGGVFKNCNFGKKLLDTKKNALDVPDNKILQNSTQNLCLPYVVVADEAFPLLPNIMRPYPGRNNIARMETDRAVFNYRLSRARRIIENAFGILSARWRIFRRPIVAGYDTAVNITKACCVLHNWLIDRQPKYISPACVDYVNNRSGVIVDGTWRKTIAGDTGLRPIAGRKNLNAPTISGVQVRDNFKQYFMADGMVDWQFMDLHNVK